MNSEQTESRIIIQATRERVEYHRPQLGIITMKLASVLACKS